jgi:hypothetical protein
MLRGGGYYPSRPIADLDSNDNGLYTILRSYSSRWVGNASSGGTVCYADSMCGLQAAHRQRLESEWMASGRI